MRGIKKQRPGRPVLSFRAVDRPSIQTRTRTLPGCRLPGCCLATIRSSRRAPTPRNLLPGTAPSRVTSLSLSAFLALAFSVRGIPYYPPSLVLSVPLRLADERRRQTPFSSVERGETLSSDGARLAACFSGAGEPAPTRTHTYVRIRIQTDAHKRTRMQTFAHRAGRKRRRYRSGGSESEKRAMRTNRIGFIIHFPSRRDLPLFASSLPLWYLTVIPPFYQ